MKVLKVIGIVILCLVIVIGVLNIIPPAKNIEENPFLVAEGEVPMIAAHRGGGYTNPENTMLAFREAVNKYNADIIESDLYLTKDGFLVYNHDAYIDRTCNVNGDISSDEVKKLCEDEKNRHYIKDMTLAELEKYNFGYYFEEDGERIYKDVKNIKNKGLQITTVDKLFEEFYETNPDLLFIVEIKNEGELGFKACEILNETLEKYPNYKNRIVVGTFHDEIEAELKEKYPHLMRGASTGSAKKFIITQLLKVNIFDNGDFACLQIPTSYDVGFQLNLNKKTLIKRAHRRNIAVQYWTINEPKEMLYLASIGCDCIMTDDPKTLSIFLEAYKESNEQ